MILLLKRFHNKDIVLFFRNIASFSEFHKKREHFILKRIFDCNHRAALRDRLIRVA